MEFRGYYETSGMSIVVRVMEYRSYDHRLGYLPIGHALTGKEYKIVDPADATSEKVNVSNRSGYVTAINPSHDVVSIEKQVYGGTDQIVDPAPMNGFVCFQIETTKGNVEEGKKIMECFDPVIKPRRKRRKRWDFHWQAERLFASQEDQEQYI